MNKDADFSAAVDRFVRCYNRTVAAEVGEEPSTTRRMPAIVDPSTLEEIHNKVLDYFFKLEEELTEAERSEMVEALRSAGEESRKAGDMRNVRMTTTLEAVLLDRELRQFAI